MQRTALVLLLFLLWSLFSWRWYVCGIKQQCGAQSATFAHNPTPSVAPDTAYAVAPTTYDTGTQLSLQEGANKSSERVPVTEGTQQALNGSIETAQVVATREAVLIHFPYNSARREDDAAADAYLQALAAHLVRTGDKVVLTGHTDAIGGNAYNNRMALQRAHHIEKLLKNKGVDGNQITVRSRGERDPLATNDKPHGRYLNRRVVVVVE